MALKSDLGPYKPKRIGHLNLVRRFNKEFPITTKTYFKDRGNIRSYKRKRI